MTIQNNDQYIELTVKNISNLVRKQFPAFYQDQSPVFIAFLEAYYKWLETENALFYSRRYHDIKDIDKTLDEFLVYFKQKYFKDIQLDTVADTRQLIKHALDIYRSKGTPQEFRLLFQLVYQKPIDIYFPSADLFKLSDGNWFVPVYLELSLKPSNVLLEGKEIIGIESGAVAFVDRIVRTTVKGRLYDIAFISARENDFKVFEKIIPQDKSIHIEDCPFIIGSLNSIDLGLAGATGNNYAIGDIVEVSSTTGEGAKVRITEIQDINGLVKVELGDGGYGYMANAASFISNTVITIHDALSMNLTFGDTVTQVRTPTSANTTGLFIGRNPLLFIRYNANTGIYLGGEEVRQGLAYGTVVAIAANTLAVSNVVGKFVSNTPLIGSTSGVSANITGFDITIGIINNSNTYISDPGNIVYSNGVANCTVSRVYNGTGATFSFNSSTRTYLENIILDTDVIADYVAVQIDATAYGFPAAPTGNLTFKTIAEMLTTVNTTVGKIKDITFVDGVGYDHIPMVVVRQPEISRYDYHDYNLGITGATGGFIIGELVTQEASGARGLVQAQTSTNLNLQNLKFANQFILTTNSTTKIIGAGSASQANVTAVGFNVSEDNIMGLNFKIAGSFYTAPGSIANVVIVDSGYGYQNDQEITFNGPGGGTGTAILTKQGVHVGYYQEKGGFLSDQKKLFDGDFYQNYSYEIISPIMLNKYQKMLKQLGHPAGTKLFGLFRQVSETNESKTINTGSITIS